MNRVSEVDGGRSTTLGAAVLETAGVIQTGPFGSQLHASDYVASGTPIVMPINLGDNSIIEKGISRVGSRDVRRLRRHVLREGDIVFSRRDDVGRRSVVRSHEAGWLCGTGCFAARFGRKRQTVNSEFVALYLGLPTVQAWLEFNAVGATMPNLNTSILASTPIRLPPRRDQDSIVAALGDPQELIEALERLIAKKQAIKQGVMQQLLTGKTRLPGFKGTWIKTTAGSIGSFKGGSGFPVRFQGSQSGQYPFFKVSDMNKPGNEIFMKTARNYISEEQRRMMGAVRISDRSIVFAKVGAAVFLERKRILFQPSCIDNNMAAMTVDPGQADVRFVHCALAQFPMSSLVATTALPSLNGSQLRSIPLALPVDLAEQRAIAAVLGDVDDEIETLFTRLAKARAVKQGMMQELLTGRTRLPVSEAVA